MHKTENNPKQDKLIDALMYKMEELLDKKLRLLNEKQEEVNKNIALLNEKQEEVNKNIEFFSQEQKSLKKKIKKIKKLELVDIFIKDRKSDLFELQPLFGGGRGYRSQFNTRGKVAPGYSLAEAPEDYARSHPEDK